MTFYVLKELFKFLNTILTGSKYLESIAKLKFNSCVMRVVAEGVLWKPLNSQMHHGVNGY